MLPVILCGGGGSRLWPLSRTYFPKQFHRLVDHTSLLQSTLSRLGGVDEVTLVANEEHRFLVAEQLRSAQLKARIILEPEGRNTAPAIALAALDAQARGLLDEVMLVLPADHHIEDPDTFMQQVAQAGSLASEGYVVTLAVPPDRAETGYGYLLLSERDSESFWVDRFVEKPDLTTAKELLLEDRFQWNSGIYLFTARCYLEALRRFAPDILDLCIEASADTQHDMDFIRINSDLFKRCRSCSIDFAIMEPLCLEEKSSVIAFSIGSPWSDLGGWEALWRIGKKDDKQNVIKGDVVTYEASNSLIMSGGRLVAAVGVDELLIVDTEDALLVAGKHAVGDVKRVIDTLKASGRGELDYHREVFRPWGKYELVASGMGYQIKRITVNPGASLSLQRHRHRAEHWVVVQGDAEVRRGEDLFCVTENQSTYIPQGVVHSLKNKSDVALIMVEIQTGSYLDEDDIERFDDEYGRA